jgi:hypothetical protein
LAGSWWISRSQRCGPAGISVVIQYPYPHFVY